MMMQTGTIDQVARDRRVKAMLLAVAFAVAVSGCAHVMQPSPAEREAHIIEELQKSGLIQDRLTALELQSGGRMGVAVIGPEGKLLVGYRADERFAMCSTFKTLLAANVLRKVDRRTLSLRKRIVYGPGELQEYAPVAKRHFDDKRNRGTMTVMQLAEASVVDSDNSAANLLLGQVGGPEEITRFARSLGDMQTRLDRNEPMLNENGLGDERDTTTPVAMAKLNQKIIFGTVLRPASRQRLTNWLIESPTGAERIRAGLPTDWKAGSKTGTCRNAYNDVAIAWDAHGHPVVMAVYLDRPSKTGPDANKVIADVARLVSGNGVTEVVAPLPDKLAVQAAQ